MLDRQFVFTLPKRLRICFRIDRWLLRELYRVAWRVVRVGYAAACDQPDAVSGMIAAIQTFGDLIHRHPHIHALVSEGVFLPELSASGAAQAGGTFLPVPKLVLRMGYTCSTKRGRHLVSISLSGLSVSCPPVEKSQPWASDRPQRVAITSPYACSKDGWCWVLLVTTSGLESSAARQAPGFGRREASRPTATAPASNPPGQTDLTPLIPLPLRPLSNPTVVLDGPIPAPTLKLANPICLISGTIICFAMEYIHILSHIRQERLLKSLGALCIHDNRQAAIVIIGVKTCSYTDLP